MLQPEAGARARLRTSSDTPSRRPIPASKPLLSLVPAATPPRGEVTDAIRDYFAANAHEHPLLAVDLSVVEWNYRALARALPETAIYYAVKANPAHGVVDRLAALGCRFDVASRGEIELCLSRGVDAARLSFGNTIKKERDIAFAHSVGVPLFAFDAEEELEKLSRSAPGAEVFCRILTSGEGADWPLSRKFGCTPAMAATLLRRAAELGLTPRGVSFHVGSQQSDLAQWDGALAQTAALFAELAEDGIELDLVNMGGGFPARYRDDVAETDAYGAAIMAALEKHFAGLDITTIAEPGRGLVGDAGVIRSEVVLVSKKDADEAERWVYLDIGKFSGLAETMDEAIKYRLTATRDGADLDGATGPVILAGPSCDSADILYEKAGYTMPVSLRAGDEVLILATGAYTSTYSSVGFNGFPPLETVCV
ncbi:MAG: type III PLP-dependent enzyme [Alphaproteobacteria bacterium]|nr:type III PLP-dependent enzyme [Alphaproteobacteria bacterium]